MTKPTRFNVQTCQWEPIPDYLLNLEEHDDRWDADDYDRRRAERDGWETAYWDGR